MNFCPNCEFKFYQSETSDGLIYLCKNCGTQEQSNETIISTIIYKNQKIDNLNVRDLVYDPSYPRMNTIECPNKQCISHKDKKLQECIFLIGNNLKKIYICVNCKTQWGY